MGISMAGFGWRALMRATFTAREYGVVQGVFSLARIPVANVISIMAGRRAFMAYCRTLRGMGVVWDKTAHHMHPAMKAGLGQSGLGRTGLGPIGLGLMP